MRQLIVITVFIACLSSLQCMSDELIDAIEHYNSFQFEQSANDLEHVWSGPIESSNDFNEAYVYMKTAFAKREYQLVDSLSVYLLSEVKRNRNGWQVYEDISISRNTGLSLFWGLGKVYTGRAFQDSTGIVFNTIQRLNPRDELDLTPYYIEISEFECIRRLVEMSLEREKVPFRTMVVFYGLVVNVLDWNSEGAEHYYLMTEDEGIVDYQSLRETIWHAVYFKRIHDNERLQGAIDQIVKQMQTLEWNQPLYIIFPLLPGQRVYEPVREDFEYIEGLIYERMGEAPPEE